MISVVSVYNNQRMFNGILLKSLENQTSKFELIALDNTKGKFKSASEALNYGGNKATGKYIMFIHQDVDLGTENWLEEVEKTLDGIPDLGIAGVAGMSESGQNFAERQRGCISNAGDYWGQKIEKEEPVQTLDELLLIVPTSQFKKMQFDEKTFDHWHCYGADYCLSIRNAGLNAYVIPASVYHRTKSTNIREFSIYKRRLFNKHKKYHKCIHTTSGEISWTKLKLMTLTDLIRPAYMTLFPAWTSYLNRDLSDCDAILDLGCGYSSPIQYCDVPFSVGIEISEADLEESIKKCIHNQYIKSKIELVDFKPNSFDAVISINSLDNFTKEEKYRIVNKMERWAKKKVIIISANRNSQENEQKDDLYQCKVNELERMGFKIIGIHGWRRLGKYDRKDQTRRIIADITQKITYQYPEFASQLYAIKELKETQT